MFVLVEMVDTVRIPPQGFQRRLNDAIAEELNEKLSNRVVHNVGLCVCLYDVTKLHDSYIFPGDDGASHTKVHFRCIVFRPFLDEILVGKVKRCGPDGVHVTMGFFDDILVPPHLLQQPARFDEAKQAWLWLYETAGKGGAEAVHFYQVDRGEEIRFRVADEIFRDTSPTGPAAAPANKTGAPALPGRSGGAPPTPAEDGGQEKEAPYVLIGSICEPVLGPLSWWSS